MFVCVSDVLARVHKYACPMCLRVYNYTCVVYQKRTTMHKLTHEIICTIVFTTIGKACQTLSVQPPLCCTCAALQHAVIHTYIQVRTSDINVRTCVHKCANSPGLCPWRVTLPTPSNFLFRNFLVHSSSSIFLILSLVFSFILLHLPICLTCQIKSGMSN